MNRISSDDECRNVRKLDTAKLDELIRSGSAEECEAVVDEILDEIGFDKLRSLILRLYVCTDIYIAAKSFAQEMDVSEEEFTERFGTVDELEEYLSTADNTAMFIKELTLQCIEWRSEKHRENSNCVVRDAKEYISSNYMKSELSLTEVASAVGITPTYLSSLFKKETGYNLSEYVTKIRIDRSKELLCCTPKLIYEIAFEVGFKDYRYFGQIFKKCTGKTPRQFQTNANIQTRSS